MKRASFLAGLAASGLLLAGCTGPQSKGYPFPEALIKNPLYAEVKADQEIAYVTNLQIIANETGVPIEDPLVLRTIDAAFVEGKKLQDKAHEMQDAGKNGFFYGVNGNYATGEALLYEDMLFFGHTFEVSAAPKMHVVLATHVAPHTNEELMSGATLDLGPVRSLYGVQQYYVGDVEPEVWNKYRTVALYSTQLKAVVALVQLRGAVK